LIVYRRHAVNHRSFLTKDASEILKAMQKG